MREIFTQLGANDLQMQIFMKMLELGAQPASIIAKHTQIPRSTTYQNLEILKKNGLIEEFDQNSMKYFKTIPAKNLPDLLSAKESQLKHSQELLSENLHHLEAIENKLSITPKVRLLEGKEGAAKMYEEVLKEKSFYSIFNPQIVKKIMPVYLKKVAETIRAKKLKVKELITPGKEATLYKKTYSSSFHQIKILPKNMKFPSDTIICKDKIYMISYGENQVTATEITNSSLAKTQTALFDQLWKIIP